ncbi:MAG: GGDEF domain-containing protein [Ectothiorhodospiraceae bacterium]|nr:GGDEF domain-containing protein [Ectothiorhodospiraceae bacterium]MCH8503904.1 GGDEF domain-containing protein [Ectothiorhodospiraceae bacterium]
MTESPASSWTRQLQTALDAQHQAMEAITELQQSLPPTLSPGREHPDLPRALEAVATASTTDLALTAFCEWWLRLDRRLKGTVLLQTAEGNPPSIAAAWDTDNYWVDSVESMGRHRDDDQAHQVLQELRSLPPERVGTAPLDAFGATCGEIRYWSADDGEPVLGTSQRILAQGLAMTLAALSLQVINRQRSVRDPLTGLFNWRYLEETLHREFHRSRRTGQSLGLLLVDLDGFAAFNRDHGTANGDRLLQIVGGLLQASFRGSDVCCRMDGGQFAVVMPDASMEDTARRARDLLTALRGTGVNRGGRSIPAPTASIGGAAYPLHGSEVSVLLDAADSARLLARQEGGDCIRIAERLE